MNRETTATFIGHRDIYGLDRALIRSKIIEFIECGVTDFLCGGMGAFDSACASVVSEIKAEYPRVKCHLVIPYLTFKICDKEKYDSVIYPDGFEKYHFKAAIPARNRWLVDNSAYALCFVTHGWGGAAVTFARAEKKELHIINLEE